MTRAQARKLVQGPSTPVGTTVTRDLVILERQLVVVRQLLAELDVMDSENNDAALPLPTTKQLHHIDGTAACMANLTRYSCAIPFGRRRASSH